MDSIDIDSIWTDVSLIEQENESKNFNKDLNCKNCGEESQNFIKEIKAGDVICKNCGVIQESHYISDEPEWNNYVEDGVMNSSNIRCDRTIDLTNPYDTGNTFIPKYMWSAHYDSEGVKGIQIYLK